MVACKLCRTHTKPIVCSLSAAVIITILYFLLALVIALLIAALYMGCNEMEPLAVKLAPAQFTPLLRCAWCDCAPWSGQVSCRMGLCMLNPAHAHKNVPVWLPQVLLLQ